VIITNSHLPFLKKERESQMHGYKVNEQVFDMKHAENLGNFYSKKKMITEYSMA